MEISGLIWDGRNYPPFEGIFQKGQELSLLFSKHQARKF